jgi:adenylylsulfate kinase-like enzyme
MAKDKSRSMGRVAHETRGFEEAAEWNVCQQISMTPQERQRAARKLKGRAFP